MKYLILSIFPLFILINSCREAPDDLAQKFITLPETVDKPWCYWYWINDDISKEGITKDLLAMKEACIGTALIGNINPAGKDGPVPLFSEEWWECMVHAVNEGKRIGIEIGVFNCPGWSQSGDPWVTPEMAMQYIVSSETKVKGPGIVTVNLLKPDSLLQDIGVLAFPSVNVGEESPRPKVSSFPALASASRLADGDLSTGTMFAAGEKTYRIVDLSEKMESDGMLDWDVPEGEWTILRFGMTPTGVKNHPAAPQGVGYEVDKMDKEKLISHFENFVGELSKRVPEESKSALKYVVAKTTSADRPNIIFILTDDQRWDALGYAENEEIQTPEMDQLAREGIYFKNAFVTTPICAASRANILTGMYERTHGYTFGQGNLKQPYAAVSYPALMRQSGYYTGFFGKFGVNYERVDSLFDVVEVYDRNGKYDDRRGYFYKTIGEDTVHLTRYTGQQAMDFIQNVPEGQPFCLPLSFSAPHAHDPAPDQYFWQQEVDSLYENHVFDPPKMADAPWFEAQPGYVRNGFNRTRWYWRYDTPEKYQRSLKGYYRMISEIDREIGKIRGLLKEKGMAKNTVIILMGDNGYFLGERQLAGKWLMYENSLRVPLIIFDPRSKNHREVDDLALNIDIPSTIFELAGLDAPESWQGIGLASYSKGGSPASGREIFLCEHLWDFENIPPSEGVRTKKWKYFCYQKDLAHEELYDLENDPDEKQNLAGVTQFQDVLEELRLKTDSISLHLHNQKRMN